MGRSLLSDLSKFNTKFIPVILLTQVFCIAEIAIFPLDQKGLNFTTSPKYLDVQENYVKEQNIHFQLPTITNLNDYISLVLFKKATTLVALDNFYGVTFSPVLSTPIILRKPKLLLLERSHDESGSDFNKRHIIWGSCQLDQNYFKDLNQTERRLCKNSKFYLPTEGATSRDICLRLDLFNFVNTTRPWNSEIHINLFLISNEIMKHLSWYHPKVFRIIPRVVIHGSTHQFYMTPSFSKILIYINAKDVDDGELKSRMKSDLRNSLLEGFQFVHVYQYVTFTFTVDIIGAKLWTKISNPKIIRHQALCTRLGCLAGILQQNLSIRFDFLSDDWMRSLKKEVQNAHKDIKVINIDATVETASFLNRVFKRLLRCGQPRHERSSHVKIEDERKEDILLEKLVDGISNVWMSILENYTITNRNGKVLCVNKEKVTSVIYLGESVLCPKSLMSISRYQNGSFYFSYFINDPVNAYKFISCGKNSLTDLPLLDLTNAYDEWSWMLILASVFSVNFTFKIILNQFGLLSTIMVLLEQGNPFSFKMTKRYLKILVGIFLLIGIILSNAYKNLNLCNMVKPRKTIPFKHFNEFVENNFTIFSRATQFSISFSPDANTKINWNETQTKLGKHGYTSGLWIYGRYFIAFINTEVEQSVVESCKKLGMSDECLSSSHLISSGIRDNVRMTSSLNSVLLESVVNDMPIDERSITYTERIELTRKYKNEVMRKEFSILVKLLKRCEKTAVILPEYLCKIITLQILESEKNIPISTGVDLYADTNWLFTLEEFVPTNLVERIKWISASGIWNRWGDIFMKIHTGKGNANIIPVAANMSGNIVLVFFIILCGFASSLTLFIMENLSCFILRSFQ